MPIKKGRDALAPLTGKQRQSAIQKLSEGHTLFSAVQVGAISVCKVHGDVQRIIRISLKSKVLVPHKWQDATSVCIYILPYMAPPT